MNRASPLASALEWKFFGVLRRLTVFLPGWWLMLILRGVLPACSLSLWVLSSLRCSTEAAFRPAYVVGTIFVLLQVLTPLHHAISANLGDRTAAWLYDRLTEPASPSGHGPS